MNDSYKDPLTNMDVNSNNLDLWKKRLMLYPMGIPDNILLNIDINKIPTERNKKIDSYFERIKLFINNKSINLLKNLISINKSNRILADRRNEYNDIMRKYNKSIMEYYDANNEKLIIRLVTSKNNDKFMAYLQYYNYKKITKDKFTPESLISDVNDYILKHQMYGLYSETTNLMLGFLIIKENRMFYIDKNSSSSNKSKKNTFYIQEVFIDKNARGRKLGKILLSYGVLLCPINKKYISLMTYSGNIMANIASSLNFKLQKKESDCPVNKMLFIKKMNSSDFTNNTVRITP